MYGQQTPICRINPITNSKLFHLYLARDGPLKTGRPWRHRIQFLSKMLQGYITLLLNVVLCVSS